MPKGIRKKESKGKPKAGKKMSLSDYNKNMKRSGNAY